MPIWNPFAHKIPHLDPEAQILLLLGRDVLQVHKVREQRKGPHSAPYAQQINFGWVVTRHVCLGSAHKPVAVTTFRTNMLNNGWLSLLTPCPSHLQVMEKLSTEAQHFASPHGPVLDESDLGSTVFEKTNNDKVGQSIGDRLFLQLMDREMYMDDAKSWVAPLPFRPSQPQLPDNRGQALHRLTSLCWTLDKKNQRWWQRSLQLLMPDHLHPFLQTQNHPFC